MTELELKLAIHKALGGDAGRGLEQLVRTKRQELLEENITELADVADLHWNAGAAFALKQLLDLIEAARDPETSLEGEGEGWEWSW